MYKNKVYIEDGLDDAFLMEGMDRWEITDDEEMADLMIIKNGYSRGGIFNIRIGKLKKYDQGNRVYSCTNEKEAKFYFKSVKY